MVVGQSAPKQAKMDEIHYVELDSEEVMMAVAESRLSLEEKKNFVEAKRISLVPWCDNDAWRPVKRTEAPNGTIVPMRFLLRYKEDKPNARVIPQGFKHRDVVQGRQVLDRPAWMYREVEVWNYRCEVGLPTKRLHPSQGAAVWRTLSRHEKVAE